MRGQAAMEFLMTYSWVIVIFLAIVSVLAYLNVFDSNRMIPESHDMGPEFSYAGHFFKPDNAEDEFAISLRTNLATGAVILPNSRETMCSDCSLNPDVWKACGTINRGQADETDASGAYTTAQTSTFLISCGWGLGDYFGFKNGGRNKVSFRFKYKIPEELVNHTYEGTISALVE